MRRLSNPGPGGAPGARALVLGAAGRLGTALVRAFALPGELIAAAKADVDILDHAGTRRALRDIKPTLVLNTAAYNEVDRAEEDRAAAFALNAAAVGNLAEACEEAGAALAHFSTDYVFDGEKGSPYLESDEPRPISAYAESKLAGERLARERCRRSFVFRVCGLYGPAESPERAAGSFVERMLSLARQGRALKVVEDQVLTPSYTMDLAPKAWRVLARGDPGLYHLTNAGETSWLAFAREAFRLAGLSPELRGVTQAEYGAKARRPRYSVLGHAGLRVLGEDDLRPWNEALAAYLGTRAPD